MLKLNEKSAKSTYIILALSIIMLVIVGIRLYSDTYAAFMQKDIASQIIRFHIRANDDSEEAQNNKMLVKAAVLDYISPKLSQSVSLEESRQILSDESDNIKNVAVDKLRSLGSKEDVSVYFENCYFPMKSYGDMTFPPGCKRMRLSLCGQRTPLRPGRAGTSGHCGLFLPRGSTRLGKQREANSKSMILGCSET